MVLFPHEGDGFGPVLSVVDTAGLSIKQLVTATTCSSHGVLFLFAPFVASA